ncbi:MAG: hypothetical protein BWK80_52295 [Desulfobacteraceae bacterium IS3]|nr:MAG: hypothetical protein BWK80_52295 [Desulfobacteraceae bacterium IS3]
MQRYNTNSLSDIYETADTPRFVRPTGYGLTAELRKVPAKLRKVLKYIFAELCGLLCETLRLKKRRTRCALSALHGSEQGASDL